MAVFIVAIIFGSIASLFIVPRYLKSQERMKMADTLRLALEKGQPLPAEIIEAMSSDVRKPGMPASPQRDLRTGIIWMGIAAGLAALGGVIGMGEPDATYPLLALACFPGFVGLAFVILGLINKPKS